METGVASIDRLRVHVVSLESAQATRVYSRHTPFCSHTGEDNCISRGIVAILPRANTASLPDLSLLLPSTPHLGINRCDVVANSRV